MPTPLDEAKQSLRRRVWDALDTAAAVRDDTSRGRIPNFIGSAEAAARLGVLPRWQDARVVKAVPDKAQRPVRALALEQGKIVYMAVPKLATDRPFYLLDPAELPEPASAAADSRTAAKLARTIEVDDFHPLDIIVLGSVAVDRTGRRLGKGAGYSDIEFALLSEAGLVTPQTLIVTTVHELQVIDEPIPTDTHDVNIDLIITPESVITCPTSPRPRGISWADMPPEKIAQIPALQRRAPQAL